METLGITDYIVFGLVLLASMAIGIVYSRIGGKQKTTGEYLMADRNMGVLPVTLSLLVSFQSAILILGFTAEVYSHGCQFWMFNMSSALSHLVAAFIFVPFLRPLHLTSAYEYLDRRFESRAVRKVGSILSIITGVGYLGTATFAPSTAIEAATGFPTWASIVITLGVCTFYTTLGGMKAVIWTDVFQFIIMFGGICVVMVEALIVVGGFEPMWNALDEGERLNFFVWDFDPTIRQTFWNLVIGGTFLGILDNSFNQANVQRIASVKTDKKAVIAMLAKFPFLLLLTVPSLLLGMCVYTYYTQIHCDPIASGKCKDGNQVLPYFVMSVTNSIPGAPGLFMAALYSGALSSNSSTLNGISANIYEDFLKDTRFYKESKKKWLPVVTAKTVVVIFGAIGIGVSFFIMTMQGPVTQITASVYAVSTGPLFGLFLLGCINPYANKIGALIGSFCAFCFLATVVIGSTLSNIRSFNPTLPPVSVSGCNVSLANDTSLTNYATTSSYATIAASTPINSSVIWDSDHQKTGTGTTGNFFALSYTLYGFSGVLITVVIGSLVSLCTGTTDLEELDPILILPVIRNCVSKRRSSKESKVDDMYNGVDVQLKSVQEKYGS